MRTAAPDHAGSGMDGQLRLKQAKVLCIGTGGLGRAARFVSCSCGSGQNRFGGFSIRLDLTNLQRQILFGTDDIGRPKIEAATDRLRNLNPDIQIGPFRNSFDE